MTFAAGVVTGICAIIGAEVIVAAAVIGWLIYSEMDGN